MGFELMTSSLPRMRSTPELHRLYRAENEVRTRDPQLGRLMLYQLSYFRKKVGGGGLEPPNPKERIYSPPQLPLCDPPKFPKIYQSSRKRDSNPRPRDYKSRALAN